MRAARRALIFASRRWRGPGLVETIYWPSAAPPSDLPSSLVSASTLRPLSIAINLHPSPPSSTAIRTTGPPLSSAAAMLHISNSVSVFLALGAAVLTSAQDTTAQDTIPLQCFTSCSPPSDQLPLCYVGSTNNKFSCLCTNKSYLETTFSCLVSKCAAQEQADSFNAWYGTCLAGAGISYPAPDKFLDDIGVKAPAAVPSITLSGYPTGTGFPTATFTSGSAPDDSPTTISVIARSTPAPSASAGIPTSTGANGTISATGIPKATATGAAIRNSVFGGAAAIVGAAAVLLL